MTALAASTSWSKPQARWTVFRRRCSNVQVVSVGTNTATLSFETDEPARGVVHYGTACGSYVGSTDPGGLTLVHTVNVTGLDDGTLHYVAVEAEDAVGNAGWDDNGGQCYPFSTEAIVYEFTLDSDPGWTREGNWGVRARRTAAGSIARDPATAYTGVNIFGYQMDDLWRYEPNMGPNVPDNVGPGFHWAYRGESQFLEVVEHRRRSG